jgi:hypothetical protein
MWEFCFQLFEMSLRLFRNFFSSCASLLSSLLSLLLSLTPFTSSSSVIYFPHENLKVQLLHTIGEGAYSFVYVAQGQQLASSRESFFLISSFSSLSLTL